jgi:hypothetical protein
VYSYILAGEAAGTAVGFIVTSSVASLTSWRGAFVFLAIPGVFLARLVWRTVPEPLRGGQSSLEVGVVDLGEAVAAGSSGGDAASASPADPANDARPTNGLAQEVVVQRGVEPDPKLVLNEDPDQMGLVRVRFATRCASPRTWC